MYDELELNAMQYGINYYTEETLSFWPKKTTYSVTPSQL